MPHSPPDTPAPGDRDSHDTVQRDAVAAADDPSFDGVDEPTLVDGPFDTAAADAVRAEDDVGAGDDERAPGDVDDVWGQQAESGGDGDDELAEDTSDAGGAADPHVPDPRDLKIMSLEAQLANREETLREYIKAHKRNEADTKAFKERLERDLERERQRARAKVVEPMLEVADNLSRSLQAAEQGGSLESLLGGLRMVERLFEQKLGDLGLTKYDPTGEPFDPSSMEAMGMVPAGPGMAGKVVMTLQPGFRLGDKELRPALVQVGLES